MMLIKHESAYKSSQRCSGWGFAIRLGQRFYGEGCGGRVTGIQFTRMAKFRSSSKICNPFQLDGELREIRHRMVSFDDSIVNVDRQLANLHRQVEYAQRQKQQLMDVQNRR